MSRCFTKIFGNREELHKTQHGTRSATKPQRGRKCDQSSRSHQAHHPATLPPGYDSLEPYVYQPLDVSKSEIRLVTVLPGEHDNPIQITLQHVSLTPLPPQPLPTVMSLEEVRATLPEGWYANRSLRDRIMFQRQAGPRSDWISTWVHPNPDISQTAYNTTMHPPASKKGIPDFEALSYAWGSLNLTATVFAHDSFEGPTVSQPIPVYRPERRLLRVGENLHEALLYLRLPNEPRVMWIDALCINQEDIKEREHQVKRMAQIYSCARKVIAWIGPEHDDAAKALQGLAHIGNQIEFLDDVAFAPSPGASEPLWYQLQVSLPFDDKFWTAVTSLVDRPWFWRLWVVQEIHMGNLNSSLKCGALENHCSDPRDIIYGLISLAPPELQEAIHVDYKADRRSDLLMFSECSTTTCENTSQLWPSWIPDWRKWKDIMRFQTMLVTSAAGQSCAEMRMNYVSDDQLRVQGVIVDVISSIQIEDCGNLRTVIQRLMETEDQRAIEPTAHDGDGVLVGLAGGYIESCIEAVHQGVTRDRIYNPPSWAGPSPNQFQQEVLQNPSFSLKSEEIPQSWWTNHYQDMIDKWLRGLKLFVTGKGRVASCYYKIHLVSHVYVSGLMNGEALLGELPDNWRLYYDYLYELSDEGIAFKDLETDSWVTRDPRLERIPLPNEWEPVAWTRKEIDPLICCRYRNKVTGELINYDPRMTGKALKERGVDIQEIILV
ncbi:heterokaryon incompatibility protein-domain-containing protein [Apiospora marii]|uniref:Heterokaryon incompatibility protein-domain-containing protein n=1 Tax=Apiospora marii TaxID=335849 RepID=A0ABR1SHS5_9PEZI